MDDTTRKYFADWLFDVLVTDSVDSMTHDAYWSINDLLDLFDGVGGYSTMSNETLDRERDRVRQVIEEVLFEPGERPAK